jgi:hypothetical protein
MSSCFEPGQAGAGRDHEAPRQSHPHHQTREARLVPGRPHRGMAGGRQPCSRRRCNHLGADGCGERRAPVAACGRWATGSPPPRPGSRHRPRSGRREAASLRLTPPELATSPVVFQRQDGTSVFRPKHSTVFPLKPSSKPKTGSSSAPAPSPAQPSRSPRSRRSPLAPTRTAACSAMTRLRVGDTVITRNRLVLQVRGSYPKPGEHPDGSVTHPANRRYCLHAPRPIPDSFQADRGGSDLALCRARRRTSATLSAPL